MGVRHASLAAALCLTVEVLAAPAHAAAPIERRVAAPRALTVASLAPQQGAQRPAWLERERVGPPYMAHGRWHAPAPQPGHEQEGVAAVVASVRLEADQSDRVIAEGEVLAAHPTLPTPSLVQVTNLKTGRDLIVRVEGRGAYASEQAIGLSPAAARVLGLDGPASRVHVRYLGPAPRRVAAAPSAGERPSAPVGLGQSAPGPAHSLKVQAGVFADVANAERAQARLTGLGEAQIEAVERQGRRLYRVRVGAFADRAHAEAARRQAIALGFEDAQLVTG